VGRRSRKARPSEVAPAPREPRLRGEAANEAVRERLEPLGPGERPVPVTIAAAVAAAIGVANLVLYLAGVEVQGERPNATGTLAFCAVMIAAAVGLWRAQYWAVLGFQALLGLIIIIFSLLLLQSSNLLAVVVSVVVIGLGGWLFWKMVGAMARIQMPSRNPHQ
jgi:hypothetical protein